VDQGGGEEGMLTPHAEPPLPPPMRTKSYFSLVGEWMGAMLGLENALDIWRGMKGGFP
jgi:hypothetical protein